MKEAMEEAVMALLGNMKRHVFFVFSENDLEY